MLDDFVLQSHFPAVWQRNALFACPASGMAIAAWARIDNRTELAEALGFARPVTSVDDPALILTAYQRWGDACACHLIGDFAFAIADPRSNRLYAARDPIGIRPLYWLVAASQPITTVVATTIPQLIAGVGHTFEVDPDWVARFVAHSSMSRLTTPFRGIEKIPPGHWLVADTRGRRLSRYHEFDADSADHAADVAEVIAGYRETLFQAVDQRVVHDGRQGIEISGGLDSATLVGCASRGDAAQRARLHGFGFAMLEHEPAAILSVSQHAGLAYNHILCRPPAPDPSWAWQVLGHPAEHGTSAGHQPIYALAQELGVRSLMSGFGGDEGVTNYAPNFGREMIGRRDFRGLWRAGETHPLRRVRFFAGHLRRAGRPSALSERLLESARRSLAMLPLRSDLVERLGIIEEREAGASFDAPTSTINAFAIQQLGQPFVSTRTESGSLLAASFGVEYSWPLLDVRLIERFLAAPTALKVTQGMGRGLHRAAVTGIVPDHRRLAPGKYLGEPVASVNDRAPSPTAPDLETLDPMIQEMIDPAKFSVLRRSATAAKATIKPQAAMPLRAIATANAWLESGTAGCATAA